MQLIDDDQYNDDAVDILGEVSLTSFKANPTHIGPFGASVLAWSVKGPSGFHVKLNGLQVAKSGQQVVHPTSTTHYRLSAHARQASRTLGNVQVAVDRASCETFEINNPRSVIQAPVRAGILNSENLYFRNSTGPAVSFSPGRIRLELWLGQRVDYFPNPSIYIDASFGLAVQNGTLEAVGELISVDVSVPFWAWAMPGALPGLAIAISMGKDSVRKRMHEAIQGLGQLLNAFALPPAGKRLSTVRVDDGNNGAGIIELTACSHDLLVKFAEISQVVILE